MRVDGILVDDRATVSRRTRTDHTISEIGSKEIPRERGSSGSQTVTSIKDSGKTASKLGLGHRSILMDLSKQDFSREEFTLNSKEGIDLE